MLQVVDADQRDVVMDALGIGDEIPGALIALAGVEHRIDPIAARRAHHRTDVLGGFGVEQADAAVPFVRHVSGPFAKKSAIIRACRHGGAGIDGQSFFISAARPANGLWVATATFGVLSEPSLKYCWSV